MSGVYVGIDGSSHSKVALEWAMREAGYRHQPLTVVAVQEVPISGWGGSIVLPGDDELRDKTGQAAQEAADKAAAELGGAAPPSVTVQATIGQAATQLIEASKDADLLVVGSRGVGGFTRLVVGSTSGQVTQHAHCPVVVCQDRPQHSGADLYGSAPELCTLWSAAVVAPERSGCPERRSGLRSSPSQRAAAPGGSPAGGSWACSSWSPPVASSGGPSTAQLQRAAPPIRSEPKLGNACA